MAHPDECFDAGVPPTISTQPQFYEPTMDDSSTVYVVSDDPVTLDSVRTLAGSMELGCEAVPAAHGFLSSLESTRRGCLIVDANMQQSCGLDFLLQLREARIGWPVIVVSAFADTRVAVRAMKLGALTVLEKPFKDYELFEAIREAVLRDVCMRRSEAKRRKIRARLSSLSAAERCVLNRVVAGQTNKAIAADLNVSVRTVEMRRRHVFAKMEAESVAELVRMAMFVRKKRVDPYQRFHGI